MSRFFSVCRFLLPLLVIVLNPITAACGNFSYNNRLQGATGSVPLGYSSIAVNKSFMVYDPEWLNVNNGSFTDQDFENRVTLRYTGAALDNAKLTTQWSFTVPYTIYFFALNSTYTTQTGSLTITYDPSTSFTDIATNRYTAPTAAYRIQVVVGTPTNSNLPGTLTEDFTLEGEISGNRTYKINTTAGNQDIRHRLPYPASNAEPAIIDPQINNVVEFNWDYFPGAEAYELSWVYRYSEAPGFALPTNLTDFSEATRVIVTDNFYDITLAYEEGYIIYCVRPLTKHYLSPDKWIPGPYYTFGDDYFLLSKSHNNTKNWAFNAVYAEDGLKGEAIFYFDGTLRRRESVTKNNTDNKAIVQSTYYDYEGRPALSTLPEPNASSGDLKFYANYNLNGAVAFNKTNFDVQSKINNPDPINGGIGGNYYSTFNSQMIGDAYSSYIPDASGYAYIRTLYGIDGLVQKQSGAGTAHKTGSGHETESYVATPLQKKLDLLFGMEAGDSRYYREYAVKDANGQLSISYENLRGQTVATALAGDAPAGIDPLASATPHVIDGDFNSSNFYSEAQQAWLNHVELFVPTPGWYKFNYTLNSSWYTSICEGGSYDCSYKFNVSIFDACNLPVDDDPSYLNNLHNIIFQTQTYTFTAAITSVSTGDFWVNFPATGTYVIEKKLSLDEASIAAEVSEYRSHIEFYAGNTNYNALQTCVPISLASTTTEMTNATDLIECTGCTTCVSTPASVDPCDALYHVLRDDMSPGGQYFDNTTTQPLVTTPTNTWLQNWVWDDKAGSSLVPWNNASYLDYSGNVTYNWDQVRSSWNSGFLTQALTNGVRDPQPQQNYNFGNIRTNASPPYNYTTTNQNLFTNLVQFHPEYCHYDWCLKTSESVDFDANLFANSTIAWAQAQGYVTGGVANITAILNADPFFNDPDFANLPYHLSDYKTAMQTLMTTGYPAFTPPTMWSYALSLTPNCTNCNDNWQVFVATYVYEKNKLMEEFKVKDFGCAYMYDAPAEDGVVDCSLPSQTNYLESYTDMATGQKACGFKIRVHKPVQYTPPVNANHPFQSVIADYNNNSLCDKVATSVFTITAVTGNSILYVNAVDISGTVPSTVGWTPTQLAAALVTAINSYTATPVYYATSQGATVTIYASPGTATTPNGYVLSATGFTTSGFTAMAGGVNGAGCPENVTNPPLVYENCFCTLMNEIEARGRELPNPVLTSSSTTLDINTYITNNLNSGYGLTIPVTDVATWRTNCSTSFENNNYPTQSPETYNSGTGTYSSTVPLVLRCYDPMSTCAQEFADLVGFSADVIYQDAVDDAVDLFERRLRAHCLGQAYTNEYNVVVQPAFSENLEVHFSEKEYHYTLYYYDLAGNLTRTVPPEAVNYFNLTATTTSVLTYTYGIDPITTNCEQLTFPIGTTVQSVIDQCRAVHNDGVLAPPSSANCYVAGLDYYRVPLENDIHRQPLNNEAPLTGDYHELVTNYKYNTLNQLTESRTPDNDGPTVFYYDSKGRVRASVDARQAVVIASKTRFSYVRYDELGRITQSGEVESPANSTDIANNIASENPAGGVFFPDNLVSSVANSSQHEVNWAFYDDGLSITGLTFQSATSYNRNRITHRIYQETYNGSLPAITGGAYDYATHYAYDVHGNVKELVQDDPTLTAGFASQRFKRVLYKYDLISGNVKLVSVQPGEADQMYYRYRYDADSKLKEAFSSNDGLHFDRDAEYFYYLHGPLARTEIGDKKVQGLDYVYTIMGWIKGVNSNTLDKTRDPGNDSKYGETSGNGSYRTIAPNLHQYVASDAAAYSLHYFNGDYTPIETQTTAGNFIADMSGISNAGTYGPDLFNGNISRMVTTLIDPNPANATPLPQVMFYQYDQLNRIKTARAYSAINLSANTWNAGAIAAQGDYYNAFTYDANGNILTQQRNGIASVAQVEDNLTYNYKTRANGNITSHRTNQLKQVAEDATLLDCSYGDDINKNQDVNNYLYDEIGNLVVDKQQYIYGNNDPSGAMPGITWTSFGKIASITKDNRNIPAKYVDCNGNGIQDGGEATLVLQDIVFKYNSDGQRVCKIVKPHNPAGGVLGQADWIYTYYLRDALGNVLATYQRKQVSSVDQFNLKEQDLYGSSRLGMVQRTLDMLTASVPGNPVKRTVGEKVYEISNHLGNVLTTISDRRIAVDANANGVVDYFKPVIISATDYSAFGAPMPGRSYSSTTYAYGMNGQIKDDEITGSSGTHYSAMYWEYDARLGRRWNTDPVVNYSESPYATFNNSPIHISDPNGDEPDPPAGAAKWVSRSGSAATGAVGANGQTSSSKPQAATGPTGATGVANKTGATGAGATTNANAASTGTSAPAASTPQTGAVGPNGQTSFQQPSTAPTSTTGVTGPAGGTGPAGTDLAPNDQTGNGDVPHWLGPTMMAAGGKFIPKTAALGSVTKTSAASVVLRNIPGKLPMAVPTIITTDAGGLAIRYTTSIAGAGARWIPVAGQVLLFYDLSKNVFQPMSQGYSEFVKDHPNDMNHPENLIYYVR